MSNPTLADTDEMLAKIDGLAEALDYGDMTFDALEDAADALFDRLDEMPGAASNYLRDRLDLLAGEIMDARREARITADINTITAELLNGVAR